MAGQDELANRYSQRIQEAGIDGLLDGLNRAIQELENPPGNVGLVIPRVLVVVEHARAVLAAADPLKTSSSRVSSLPPLIARISDQFAAVKNGEDRSVEIDTELDGLLDGLALLSLPSTAGTPTSQKAAGEIRAMRGAFTRAENEVKQRAGLVETQLKQLGKAEEAAKSRLAELTSQIEQASATFGEARASSVAHMEETRTAISGAIAELRASFDTTTQESIAAGKARIDAQLETASADQVTHLERAQTALAAQEAAAKALLDKIKATETQVMKVASALGTGAQSAGWGSYADKERKAANWMRGLAIASFSAAVAFAIALAFSVAKDTKTVEWHWIATKVAVATAFGLVGGYLSAQSTEHRHQERMARRRHLDLLALPLFIAKLEPTDRDNIVKQLASSSFLTPEPPHVTKAQRKSLGIDQIREIAEIFGPRK